MQSRDRAQCFSALSVFRAQCFPRSVFFALSVFPEMDRLADFLRLRLPISAVAVAVVLAMARCTGHTKNAYIMNPKRVVCDSFSADEIARICTVGTGTVTGDLMASRAVVGDRYASAQVLHRAAANALPVRVVVFGGSITAGHQCRNDRNVPDMPCAWPSKLEKEIARFGICMEIVNMAIGGCGIEVATRKLIRSEWDTPHRGTNCQSRNKDIAWSPDIIIYAGQANDVAYADFEGWEPAEKTENFVRTVFNMEHRPVLIFVDDFSPLHKNVQDDPTAELKRWISLSAEKFKVLTHYSVPTISMRELLVPKIAKECSPDWICTNASVITKVKGAAESVHFSENIHNLTAIVVLYNLVSDLKALCDTGERMWVSDQFPSKHMQIANMPCCTPQTTIHNICVSNTVPSSKLRSEETITDAKW